MRLWGIGWGFPLQRGYVDEFVTVFYTLRLFETGPNPYFFDYPSLYLYLLWVVLFVLRFAAGQPFTIGAFLDDASTAPIWAGRILTVALAVAGVLLVVHAGRAWRDNKAGLWAGLFLALQSVHVRMSHYAMPDILSVTLTTAAIFMWTLFVIAQERGVTPGGAERYLFLSGLFLGLAAATKYTPGFMLPGLVLWLLVQKQSRFAAVLAGAAFLGFFLGSPFSVLAWREFLPRVGLLTSHIIVGETAAAVNPFARWARSLLFLPQAFHPALLVLGAAGFLWTRDSVSKSLGWAALFYFLCTGLWKVVADRYYLPLVPAACVGAGCFLSRFSERKAWPAAVLGAAAALLLLWPGVAFNVQISRRDTRLEMRDWVRAHVSSGARILRFPHTTEFVAHDPFAVRVDWEGKLMDRPPEALLQEYDYVLTAHFSPEPDDVEKGWKSAAREVHSVSGKAVPAFPHQPRLRLWGKRTS